MNKIKIKGLKKVLLFTFLFLIILYLVVFFGIMLMNFYLYDNEEKSEDLLYYDKIVDNIKKNDIIELKNIFEFDFDYIYMPSDENFSSNDLKETLGIEYDVKDVNSTWKVLHVYFIKDNKVVYEFNYTTEYLIFYPLDEIIIIEDTVFEGSCNKGICSLTLVDKK